MANCLVCGVEFTPKHATVGKYCSIDCYHNFMKDNHIGYKPITLQEIECRQCHRLFKPDKSTTKYCSKRCQWESLKRQPDTICQACGRMFVSNWDHRKYCSNECRSKAKRKYETQEDAKRAKYENKKAKLRLEREALAPILEAKRAEAAAERAKKKAEREAAKTVEREQKRQERLHPCEICGEMTDRKKFCSDQCANKAANRQKEISRRHKLRENGKVDYSVTLEKLVKRDRNICHICGGKCDMNDCITVGGTFIAGDNYPSIDHLMPVARGGVHSWDNVKLAHRICNTKKAARRVFETESGQLRFAI